MSTFKELLDRAKTLGIDVPEYRARTILSTSEELLAPDNVLDSFDKEKFSEYIDALYYSHSYNAGGYNGWATAHDKLEKLGMQKVKLREGHRIFQSMTWEEQPS